MLKEHKGPRELRERSVSVGSAEVADLVSSWVCASASVSYKATMRNRPPDYMGMFEQGGDLDHRLHGGCHEWIMAGL